MYPYGTPRGYKTRKCRHFSDDGEPLPVPHSYGYRGCPSLENCKWAHPSDPQWATAVHDPGLYRPRPPPPPPPRGPPPSHGPPPPGESSRELPSKPLGRVASASSLQALDLRDRLDDPGRDPRPPPSGVRRDTSLGATSIASSSDQRVRRESLTSSHTHMQQPSDRRREDGRPPYREDSRDRRRSEDRRSSLREDDRRIDDRRRDESERRYREDAERRRDRDRRSRSRSRSRRESFAAPPPKQLTEEERRKVWNDRIKVLAESVAARSETSRLAEEIAKYERLTRSTQFDLLPDEDKKSMSELIATTKQRLQTTQTTLTEALGKLIPTDFYPFAQPASRQADTAYYEMTNTMGSLQKDVTALYDVVNQLQTASASIQTPLTPLAASATAPEAGEITQASGSRPKKRLRVDDAGESAAAASGGEPTMEDLNKLLDRLVVLDGRVSGVENDMQQYDQRVIDEVDAQLDYLGLSRQKAGGASNEELTETVAKLTEELNEAEARAATVASGLAQLQLDSKSQDEAHARLEADNKKLQETFTELRDHYADTMKTLESRSNELQALRATVQALLRQPLPPPPPQPPSSSEIIEAIRPAVLKAACDDIRPLLAEAKSSIDISLKEQINEFNHKVAVDISPTVRNVENISIWAGRLSGAGGATGGVGQLSSTVDKGKGRAV